MKITFIINGQHIEKDVNVDNTILKVKQELIEQYYANRNDVWLMLKFNNEKPIREYGKQDLIPGEIPLTLDYKRLSNFSIRNDFTYIFEVKEFKRPIINKIDKCVNHNCVQNKKYIFDITNNDDFPKL